MPTPVVQSPPNFESAPVNQSVPNVESAPVDQSGQNVKSAPVDQPALTLSVPQLNHQLTQAERLSDQENASKYYHICALHLAKIAPLQSQRNKAVYEEYSIVIVNTWPMFKDIDSPKYWVWNIPFANHC